MLSIKNIKIPFNYVLLKLDEDYTTFQFKGKETNLLSPSYDYKEGNRIDAKHKNYATTGAVYGVPEKIRFTREQIKAIKGSVITERNGINAVADGSLLYKINRLKEAGCRFQTENELVIGDKVKFAYQARQKAEFFDTQEGKMCFVKYDDIYMTLDGKMINGYILVDPETKDTNQEGAVTFTESKSGLILPKLGETYKRSARWQHGAVIHAGKPLTGGYFDLSDYVEPGIEVSAGDKLIFDPRTAMQFEHNNHMAWADRKLFLIQRKDILFMRKDNPKFDELCTI